MSDDAQPDEPKKPAIIFEKAVSGRSTCKATGEKIEKGELRVGLEAYLGGRISMTWQVCDPHSCDLASPLCPRAVLRFPTARAHHLLAAAPHGASKCCQACLDASSSSRFVAESDPFPGGLPPRACTDWDGQVQGDRPSVQKGALPLGTASAPFRRRARHAWAG